MSIPTNPSEPFGSNVPPAGVNPPQPEAFPPPAGVNPPPAPPPGWATPPPPPQTPAWSSGTVGGLTNGSFDPKSVDKMDWAIVGAGGLAFIFSLFGFYTASVSVAGFKQSESASAWHEIFGGGFFGWIAMVLAVLGAAVLALSVLSPSVMSSIPVPPRLLTLYLFSAGFIAEILAIVIHPKFVSGPGFKFSHGFAFWISLIVIAAGAVLSFLRLQATGGSLPWKKGNTG